MKLTVHAKKQDTETQSLERICDCEELSERWKNAFTV